MKYRINELKSGLKIIQDKEPSIIIDIEFIKPGKGQSFCRIKIKKLISNKIIEKIFKSGDLIKKADIEEISCIYLYNDKKFGYFMNEKNYEQYIVNKSILKKHYKWLIEELKCILTFWNKIPIFIVLPNFVKLIVIDTSLESQNNSSNNTKYAKLITGAFIKVPFFIQINDLIKIDTRSGEYICRIKN
ncbi:elongation factor P [Sodalis-like secondary symbiont of Drepanosiphum platanoidis]|uniref:elongation factor P n=1 Tax=Sodalis-like secondary symbiont of Drepanosiphum platanoidis TaxID=2994493 RepID=UPI00346433A2